jgi:hypothetical protein
MRLRIHRSDGKTGTYHQDIASRASMLLKRLNPNRIFSSGPIVIGVHTPFNVLNPDEVCWVEVETDLQTTKILPRNIDLISRLPSRSEYESLLAQQWSIWLKQKKGKEGDPMEAFVELSLRSGESLFLYVKGKVGDTNLVDTVFGEPAITATFAPRGTVYINPKGIVRARIYHSKDRVKYPPGTWIAEADDI